MVDAEHSQSHNLESTLHSLKHKLEDLIQPLFSSHSSESDEFVARGFPVANPFPVIPEFTTDQLRDESLWSNTTTAYKLAQQWGQVFKLIHLHSSPGPNTANITILSHPFHIPSTSPTTVIRDDKTVIWIERLPAQHPEAYVAGIQVGTDPIATCSWAIWVQPPSQSSMEGKEEAELQECKRKLMDYLLKREMRGYCLGGVCIGKWGADFEEVDVVHGQMDVKKEMETKLLCVDMVKSLIGKRENSLSFS